MGFNWMRQKCKLWEKQEFSIQPGLIIAFLDIELTFEYFYRLAIFSLCNTDFICDFDGHLFNWKFCFRLFMYLQILIRLCCYVTRCISKQFTCNSSIHHSFWNDNFVFGNFMFFVSNSFQRIVHLDIWFSQFSARI